MRHQKPPPQGYPNQSERKVTWTPVVNPAPVFDSAAQKLAVEQAQRDNPRRDGEGVLSWLERINVAAGVMVLSQCEHIERDWREETVDEVFGPRDPGSDDA